MTSRDVLRQLIKIDSDLLCERGDEAIYMRECIGRCVRDIKAMPKPAADPVNQTVDNIKFAMGLR
jgi:hypothetical protein